MLGSQFLRSMQCNTDVGTNSALALGSRKTYRKTNSKETKTESAFLSCALRLPEKHYSFEGSRASHVCPDKSNVTLHLICNIQGTTITKENLSQYHFAHHKSHMD